MAADETIIIACPSCSQKYRVPEKRIGARAMCKKCGQRFKIAVEAPIDEDTLFGWVMEGDPGSESVMGSTAIFDRPTPTPESEPAPKPKPKAAKKPAAAAKARKASEPTKTTPRVRFDRIDEIGAYVEFPADKLVNRDLRMSFPQRCARCLTTDDLNVHLLIWGDKLPRKDALKLREAEVKTVRSLSALIDTYGERWQDQLDDVDMLPAPFSLPFPYFVCRNCSSVGTVTQHILNHDGREFCQLAIANLSLAAEFYRHNGGGDTPAYKKLLLAARSQRDNQWSSLPFPVRAKISQWFTIQDGETFKGYFADSDFSHSEAGAAGLILTDRRMVYKKYTARREFNLATGGSVEIEASKSAAMIEIAQPNQRTAVLAVTPMAAGSLAKSLKSLDKPWSIHAVTSDK
jgi:predicted Zn finger-like uncharacterized protein